MQFQIPYHVYADKYPTKLLAFYHALRESIVQGVLPYRTRLPSSRTLAGLYGVSRGTVNQVYDMLSSEGYVACEVGRGTYVAFQTAEMERPQIRKSSYSLSDWGWRLERQPLREVVQVMQPKAGVSRSADFHFFAPDPLWFPQEEWNRCLYAQARHLSECDAEHAAVSTQGDPDLRECIAHYLRRARGIPAHAEHVVIVNGSMQAIALAVQLLINAGDRVIVESPGYGGIQRAVAASGGVCVPSEVDSQGIVPAAWDAKLLFVTPNRQFPTGAVLSMERRQELLKWAYESDAIIIEDDYDSEFRHRGKALEPLKVLDHEERVLYVGSFTKTLLPSVRLGYAVLPPALTGAFVKAKALFEPQPSGLLNQKTLAAFMMNGQYERHLRRMKRIYSRKFEYLHELLTSKLSNLFTWVEGDAGLHIFGWWRGTLEQYVQFRNQCGMLLVRWSEAPLVDASGTTVRYGAYFHFPHLAEEEMDYGVQQMREIADDYGIAGN